MKFTLSWLNDHLDLTAPLDKVVSALTNIGLEVEGVEDKAKDLSAFLIAHVVSAEQHPNADRLRVCSVDIGTGELIQVVCGAPNARANMKSVFAPPGTYIPAKNITLSIGQIRGVESRGMLCSGAELGLSDDADGIIDLPENAPIGAAYATYAGFDDPVIDINLTPNRADCASIHGIARDLAATSLVDLKGTPITPVKGQGACGVEVHLSFARPQMHLCPAFALRKVRGVKNGPAPEAMQKRLRAIGLRPINALVDITNYLTFDQGRPLHVFDAAKVKGDLVVRLAEDGERFKALDGRTYTLDASMVVIADDAGVQSLAGIMGGEATGCDENTTDVLIECALWDPINIAQTGRKLGVQSDARYRFERGVDPDFCHAGLDLATHKVVELCGGAPSERVLAGDIPETSRIIDFPWSEIQRLSGFDVPRPEAKVILMQLGFHISGSGERVKVSPPSWRADVTGKADLVEEVIRIVGLDRIAPEPLPAPAHMAASTLSVLQKRTRAAKRLLAARGLSEAMTWSFISHDHAALFGGGKAELALANPIAANLSDMRPSLVPGLITSAQMNADRGLADVALFEVGQCFLSDQPEGQLMKAAGLRRGQARSVAHGRDWRETAALVDCFDAKADVMALLEGLNIAVGGLQIVPGGPNWLHPGRSGTLQFGPKNIIGFFGELHPQILQHLDVKGHYAAFEIMLDVLPSPKAKTTRMKPKLVLSPLQPLIRDFAFIVPQNILAGDMIKAAQAAERILIEDVRVFDVYEGKGIEDGKKSIALAVTLQPREKTLTEAEIEIVSHKIIAEMTRKTGAVLRSAA
jgi:phenylalanyl-tRNA synthetase beta chain